MPVLPATTTPGICAAVPVPAWTTSTIMFFSSPAVDGLVACRQTCGWSFATTEPVGDEHLA